MSDKKKEFWQWESHGSYPVLMEFRAMVAVHLLDIRMSQVGGDPMLAVDDDALIDQALEMADKFVTKLDERGWIKEDVEGAEYRRKQRECFGPGSLGRRATPAEEGQTASAEVEHGEQNVPYIRTAKEKAPLEGSPGS